MNRYICVFPTKTVIVNFRFLLSKCGLPSARYIDARAVLCRISPAKHKGHKNDIINIIRSGLKQSQCTLEPAMDPELVNYTLNMCRLKKI